MARLSRPKAVRSRSGDENLMASDTVPWIYEMRSLRLIKPRKIERTPPHFLLKLSALQGKSQPSTICCDSTLRPTRHIHTKPTFPARPKLSDGAYRTHHRRATSPPAIHSTGPFDGRFNVAREHHVRSKFSILGQFCSSVVPARPRPHAFSSRTQSGNACENA